MFPLSSQLDSSTLRGMVNATVFIQKACPSTIQCDIKVHGNEIQAL